MELYARALELIPGGTQLVSRRPTRFANGVSPAYATRAEGSRFWDVDGNEYIDWVSGIGAIILGYADPVVDAAVKRQIDKGLNYSINHELEIELAEELVKRIPCAEMVRYAKGGGEACAIAIRIARGATAREKVLFCGYHGWHDWYLAANLNRQSPLDSHLFPGIDPVGVPQSLDGTALPFAYGDVDSLRQLLDEHRGEVACIIMEPLRSDHPPAGFLEDVATLSKQHGVVLIFDEVSTGFRPSDAGVQSVVGVMPDLAVFAKSISNGYPFGAVVGRREVMRHAETMFISSTYWSDTIGLRAALTTLREIRKRGADQQIREYGEQLQTQLNEIADCVDAPITCQGVNYHPYLNIELEDDGLKRKVSTLYVQEMAKRGCHGYTSFYLNAAQNDVDLKQTTEAARQVFSLIRDALQSGTLDAKLSTAERTESFRRLVR